jgi:murein DD-endopeptidase MepM/ murein hydrolase activator NlpD
MVVALAMCAGASCDRGAAPDRGPFFTTPADAPATTPGMADSTRAPEPDIAGNAREAAPTIDGTSGAAPDALPARDATVPPDNAASPASVPWTAGTMPEDLARLSASLDVPVAGVARSSLRDTYSEARGDRVHEALDILAPRGTPVISATDGRVLRLFDSRPGGLMVYATDTPKACAPAWR